MHEQAAVVRLPLEGPIFEGLRIGAGRSGKFPAAMQQFAGCSSWRWRNCPKPQRLPSPSAMARRNSVCHGRRKRRGPR